MSSDNKTKDEILLSLLEFLDRNGYKESFDILQQNTGIRYLENDKNTIKNLLKNHKLDEFISFINSNTKINSKEKNVLVKLLKIRKYIELVYNNCSDRIDQKDSLNYLRKEITPIIKDNSELLNSLTKILFFKDMTQLKNFMQKNLSIYEDDNYIVNQLCKIKITPLEQLYNIYNKTLVKKYGIYFDKYKILTIDKNEKTEFQNSEISNYKISPSKKLFVVGFKNLKISIFSLNFENENNLEINLNSTFSVEENNNSDEISNISINSTCFSYDEKKLLVSLSNSKIKIFDIENLENSKLLKEFNIKSEFSTPVIYISEKDKYIFGTKDKNILISNDDNENTYNEIKTENEIKQLLYSEFNNNIFAIFYNMKKISCLNLNDKNDNNNNELTTLLEFMEDIICADLSKNDKGKYLLINISKIYPKILLYNLSEKKIDKKYYGHLQKTKNVVCNFGGSKDQFILSTSEDYIIYLWDRQIGGLPKYQFRGHFGFPIGVGMINSSIILSVSEDQTIKFWTSYDIENIKFNNKEEEKKEEKKVEDKDDKMDITS